MNQILNKNKNKKVNQYDENGLRHGYWEVYYDDNNTILRLKGNYIHGKMDGYWERYWNNSKSLIIGNYDNGKHLGLWQYYSSNKLILISYRI